MISSLLLLMVPTPSGSAFPEPSGDNVLYRWGNFLPCGFIDSNTQYSGNFNKAPNILTYTENGLPTTENWQSCFAASNFRSYGLKDDIWYGAGINTGVGLVGIPSFSEHLLPVKSGFPHQPQFTWTSGNNSFNVSENVYFINKLGHLYGLGTNTEESPLGIGANYGIENELIEINTSGNWTNITSSAGAGRGINKVGTALAINEGKLYAWGSVDEFVRLNDPIAVNANPLGLDQAFSTPSPIRAGSFDDWSDVATNGIWSLAIRDGKLYTCGYASGVFPVVDSNCENAGSIAANLLANEIFSGTGVFTQIQTGISDWKKCKVSESYSVAQRENGSLYWWGVTPKYISYESGEILSCLKESPELIDNDTWEDFSCAADFFAGIKSGELYTIGRNKYGQLGIGETSDGYNTFQKVGNSHDWITVDASRQYILGIKKNIENFNNSEEIACENYGYLYYYGLYVEKWEPGLSSLFTHTKGDAFQVGELTVQTRPKSAPPLPTPVSCVASFVDYDIVSTGSYVTTEKYNLDNVDYIRVAFDYGKVNQSEGDFTNVNNQDYVRVFLSDFSDSGITTVRGITPIPISRGNLVFPVCNESGLHYIHVGYSHEIFNIPAAQETCAPNNQLKINEVELI